jgi:hypothetical protein
VSSTVRSRLTHASATTLIVIALACAAGALGGCGNGATGGNFTTPLAPTGFLTKGYPADGVSVRVPDNWTVTAEKTPMVAVISSGPAIMSLWRYPSSQGALTTPSQLHGALSALISAAKSQDPTLQVERTGLSSVDGAGAVIIDGLEHVAGKLRRVRSEHVYVNGAELVLDAYAPVSDFTTVDHSVFSPVRKSLTLLNGGVPKSGTTTSTTSTTSTPSTPSTTATTSTAATSTTSTAATTASNGAEL